jgi:hypothetical protein
MMKCTIGFFEKSNTLYNVLQSGISIKLNLAGFNRVHENSWYTNFEWFWGGEDGFTMFFKIKKVEVNKG